MTGREIAAQERLPGDYVEQILLQLRRAGIVRSTRGAHGGYTLARLPDEITVRDVISAAEHSTFDVHCRRTRSRRSAARRRTTAAFVRCG